jgi:hypothetical protein
MARLVDLSLAKPNLPFLAKGTLLREEYIRLLQQTSSKACQKRSQFASVSLFVRPNQWYKG